MTGYIYLIRNGSLHNIGFTKKLEIRMEQLQPDEIVATLQTETSEEIAKKLQALYSNSRLPLSDYYRLTKKQAADCKLRLIDAGGKDGSLSLRGVKLATAFLIAWIGISGLIIKFGIEPIFIKFGVI